MAETAQPAEPSHRDRHTARLARRIRAFAAAHGGTEGQISYLGERGFRIVLVAEDGAWGDLVAPTRRRALDALDSAAVPVREALDAELSAKIRTGPYEWSRMAGIQL